MIVGGSASPGRSAPPGVFAVSTLREKAGRYDGGHATGAVKVETTTGERD